VKVAARRGHRRAVTAVARKLAVIMHRMWLDGTEFRFAAGAPTDGARPDRKRAALATA
jgi:transposase